LHVIPGVVNAKPFIVTLREVTPMTSAFRRSNYQFIIEDTQPGYGEIELSKHVDETLIITTPDMPSIASAIRVSHSLNDINARHSLVVNMCKNRRYEVSPREIEEMYDGKVQAALPADDIVPIGIEAHIPPVELNRRSRFSKAMMAFANGYCFNVSSEPRALRGPGILRRLFGKWRNYYR
jgi:MinD-like ATPase involved in chromosome partitioning or flagellar assembly